VPNAVVIGAGPAGLTAAYELLTRTDFSVVVLEASDRIGGISRTEVHNGNRIDIGGHRFFSKSDRVMAWWFDMMPLEAGAGDAFEIAYQGSRRAVDAPAARAPAEADDVLLVRRRRSRIFHRGRFFDYPLSLSWRTVRDMGLLRTTKMGASYLNACLFPRKPEKNLEDFLVNRFGRELYKAFFESYTEKVWGVPCERIAADWGAQRIKGLSVRRALAHAIKAPFRRRGDGDDLAQKDLETSLIDRFLYPKLGPGQMWETCARRVRELGGEIRMEERVEQVHTDAGRVTGVTSVDARGTRRRTDGDVVFSTMPVKHLVRGLAGAPAKVREVAEGLLYRDFVTVGLLLDRLLIHEETPEGRRLVRDNWIYIQEPGVEIGRLQIFNNWSPGMVADPDKVWIGLEYFCQEGDALWSRPDAEMAAFGEAELARLGIVEPGTVLDSVVLRVPKTYPAYFGTYDRFDEIRAFVDPIEGLYLVGRNGMHRYNNQDHSMLAAMTAVDNLVAGRTDKQNVWDVNTEQEYHEEKA